MVQAVYTSLVIVILSSFLFFDESIEICTLLLAFDLTKMPKKSKCNEIRPYSFNVFPL